MVGLEALLPRGALEKLPTLPSCIRNLCFIWITADIMGYTLRGPSIDAFLLGPMRGSRRISLPSPHEMLARTWCVLRSLCFPKEVNSQLAAA